MTELQIENKVKAVFTSDIPDNFDEILKKCEEQDKIIAMPKQSKWNKNLMMRVISTAAVVVVVFTAGMVGFRLTKEDLQGPGDKFSSDNASVSDDFFCDSVTQNDGDDFLGETVTDDKDNTNSDSVTSGNNDTNNNGGSNATSIPNNNSVNGMSWKEMLAAMPKKLRGTKLTVYNWVPANEYAGAPGVIEKFTQQTGITVRWQTIPYDSYFTKLAATIAAGKNIPDIVRARGPIPEYMLSYQPLSTAKFDFSDEVWDKDVMDLYTVNGNIYATSLKNTHISSVNLLFYNKVLIDKHNFEDPYKLWKKGKWDFEKYLEMCREYKNITGNIASCGEGWYRSYPAALGIQGAIAFDGKKFYNNMKDEDFLSVHKMLGDLYNVEKLFDQDQSDLFDQGQRLFAIGNSGQMKRNNSYFANLKSENALYAVPMPAPKGAKRYTQGFGEAEAYAIAKGASNPEAVPYFLRYFLDGSNYELGNYFCNLQNLEVYLWSKYQKNQIFVYEYPQEIGATDSTGIIGQTGNQMLGYINSKMDEVDSKVKEYNDTFKKINK